MIELLFAPGDEEARWVEAALKDMVLAYERVELEPEQVESALGKPVDLPAIRHDERIVSGREGLLAYLQELEKLAADWRRFQSDACYVDDGGDVC